MQNGVRDSQRCQIKGEDSYVRVYVQVSNESGYRRFVALLELRLEREMLGREATAVKTAIE